MKRIWRKKEKNQTAADHRPMIPVAMMYDPMEETIRSARSRRTESINDPKEYLNWR